MLERSWNELQVIAEKAALGIGVPFAQAARFGVAAAYHLALHKSPDLLDDLLDAPELILTLSLMADRAVEAASVGQDRVQLETDHLTLVESYIESLPCRTDLRAEGNALSVRLMLEHPNRMRRPARLFVPDELWKKMRRFASRTYVPDSAESRLRGAGAIETD